MGIKYETKGIIEFLKGNYYPNILYPPCYDLIIKENFLEEMEKACKKEYERINERHRHSTGKSWQ